MNNIAGFPVEMVYLQNFAFTGFYDVMMVRRRTLFDSYCVS